MITSGKGTHLQNLVTFPLLGDSPHIGAIKIKSGTNDYFGEGNPHAKFGNIPITGGFSPSQQSSVEL